MIDHIGVRTRKLDAMISVYKAALEPLGYIQLVSFGGGAGFGRDDLSALWITAATDANPSSAHIALSASSRVAVDRFFAAALAAGCTGNGAPGPRPDCHPGHYAACVIDLDGNNLEAVCHAA